MNAFNFILWLIVIFTPCLGKGGEYQPPLTVVIFGATGDLSARKLYPALYNLDHEGELKSDFQIIGIGRRDLSQNDFGDSIKNALTKFSRTVPSSEEWTNFKDHLRYQKVDFTNSFDYLVLADLLKQRGGDVLFFLATESSYFHPIMEELHQNGLLTEKNGFVRTIIEKPFGNDLDSALALQTAISPFLDEDQIFLMDHYLGKEGVLKLTKFRLVDAPYEDYLNKNYVKGVQITLSETIGIGTRAQFYENTGHLRDVIQNHAMQVLAFALMEPPSQLHHNEIVNEKAKVFEALCPIKMKDVTRAQYSKGIVDGINVPGYREEKGVPSDSLVETFVQVRLYIDNARWDSIPIDIVSGKRLKEQLTQVKYFFKENPLLLEAITVIIQPKPRILITQGGFTLPYLMEFDPALEQREGYENQLLAAIKGDKTAFATPHEVLSSWKLLTPVLQAWANNNEILFYEAGSFGPGVVDND